MKESFSAVEKITSETLLTLFEEAAQSARFEDKKPRERLQRRLERLQSQHPNQRPRPRSMAMLVADVIEDRLVVFDCHDGPLSRISLLAELEDRLSCDAYAAFIAAAAAYVMDTLKAAEKKARLTARQEKRLYDLGDILDDETAPKKDLIRCAWARLASASYAGKTELCWRALTFLYEAHRLDVDLSVLRAIGQKAGGALPRFLPTLFLAMLDRDVPAAVGYLLEQAADPRQKVDAPVKMSLGFWADKIALEMTQEAFRALVAPYREKLGPSLRKQVEALASERWPVRHGFTPAIFHDALRDDPEKALRYLLMVQKGEDGEAVLTRAQTYFAFWGRELTKRVPPPAFAAIVNEAMETLPVSAAVALRDVARVALQRQIGPTLLL
jgi:hypothetical protein